MTLKEQAESLGIKVDGRWSDERIQSEIDKVENAAPQAHKEASRVDAMNDLARRIWEGQSVSLPHKHRVARVVKRLKNKGYTDEEIKSLNIG